VTLSRGGGDHGNEFPYGDCDGPFENTDASGTGCGWIYVNERSYYIMPWADLRDADLTFGDLSGADLRGANLKWASLHRVKANSSTTCPNGKKWGTVRNDCGFD
jgi:hypothetical protein